MSFFLWPRINNERVLSEMGHTFVGSIIQYFHTHFTKYASRTRERRTWKEMTVQTIYHTRLTEGKDKETREEVYLGREEVGHTLQQTLSSHIQTHLTQSNVTKEEIQKHWLGVYVQVCKAIKYKNNLLVYLRISIYIKTLAETHEKIYIKIYPLKLNK